MEYTPKDCKIISQCWYIGTSSILTLFSRIKDASETARASTSFTRSELKSYQILAILALFVLENSHNAID